MKKEKECLQDIILRVLDLNYHTGILGPKYAVHAMLEILAEWHQAKIDKAYAEGRTVWPEELNDQEILNGAIAGILERKNEMDRRFPS